VIAGETTPTGTLMTGYVMPLAGISAGAGLIGGSIIGQTLPFTGMYRVPIATGIVLAVFSVCMAVVGVFALSAIINAVAPSFGTEKNDAQAMKVAVYSFTPAWVAGVLQILPALGVLAVLGVLYGLYLLYLGLPRLMKCPQDKAVGYTVVVIVAAVVVTLVINAIGVMIIGGAAVGTGVLGSVTGTTPAIEFETGSPLGRLQQPGDSLEESNRTIEAAERSGGPNAEAAAALEGLGALLGGGRRVEPVDIEQLQPFVPDTFAGLPKTGSNAQKNGLGGLMVSQAEASYGDGAGRRVSLEIVDTGGIGGVMGIATWMGVQGEREDDDEIERTRRVGNRMVHEKRSKIGGTHEYGVVVGDRFMVNASGRGVEPTDLERAVTSLDLDALEAMK
jgi:hypothetical protein